MITSRTILRSSRSIELRTMYASLKLCFFRCTGSGEVLIARWEESGLR